MYTNRERIRQFILHNFVFDDNFVLRDDLSFLDAGIVDSTGMLELISFLEADFGIHFSEEELVPENLDSVERIVAFLNRKTSGDTGTSPMHATAAASGGTPSTEERADS